MLITTRGIIFRFTKYRETSIIANIYTEELGLNSYIVNGVRSAKGKFKIGYFEPLNLVELTAYHKPGRDIERLTEIKTGHPLHSIRQDMHKSAISLFMAEILNKCIVERHKNEALFAFLYSAIMALEKTPPNNSFHLQFLLKLTAHLGFGIYHPEVFISEVANPGFYHHPGNSRLLQHLLEGSLEDVPAVTAAQRQAILTDILHYYQTQIEMPPLKSLAVLQSVFS